MEKINSTGRFLKSVREENGETMKVVAARISSASSLCTQYEAGHRKFSEKIQKKIVKAYRLTEAQKQKLSELVDSVSKETKNSVKAMSQTEFEVFYTMMMFPKEIRDRIIKAIRAYESNEESNI